jgi:ribosome maturation factor RimP
LVDKDLNKTTDNEVVEKVLPLAEEICDREGYKLYDIEFVKGQNILRVFIDKEGEGVNLDDCANFSQGLNFLLDSEDPIQGAYNLEVSSPGLDRALNKKWHFDAQLGKKIKVIIKARTETSQKLGMKKLEGLLEKVESNGFILRVEEKGATYELPFSDVHKCNVVFEGF